MKEFFQIMRRYLPPYSKNVVLNVVFNFLATLLTLFSFALIIPILEILFRIREAHYVYMPLADGSLKDVAINNFYYLVQQCIDTYGEVWALMGLAAGLVVMTGLKCLTSYLATFFLLPMRVGVIRDMRNEMYDKMLSLHIGFFSNERKGDVMARMAGDVGAVENSMMTCIDMLIKNPIMIIGCLAMMIALSWQLTVFVLVLLPVAGWIMGVVGQSLKASSLTLQNLGGQVLSNLEESIGGLRIIKAFVAEGKMSARFHQVNAAQARAGLKVQRRQSLAHPVSEFLGTVTIAIVLVFGGMLIISGESSITAADFIYYLVVFYSMINPAKELAKSAYQIQTGLAAMERVDRILKAENPIVNPANPRKPQPYHGNVDFNDVHFSYQEGNEVIKGVDLHIPAGATVALVGQSGSGKTTMADLLPRFYDVTSGSVTVDGVNVKDMNVTDLRSLMGNVNQEAILFNDTIYNNIAFGVDNATPEMVEAAARVANAHDFITATEHGYDTMIGDRGCKLSGGQRQRLSIARAVLKNPSILILDEATSALDTESERLVQEALERLMSNRTTLVIAHRLSTIKNADMIAVMSEGRIVESGTHSELMSLNGHYRRLVEMQNLK